jgi:hypothetical protein
VEVNPPEVGDNLKKELWERTLRRFHEKS